MKHIITWGGILGLLLVAFSLGLYLLDMTESKPAQWINYIILGTIIFFGTKAKRTDLGGYLTYGQGLGTGAGIAFFGSVLVAIYTYLFFTVIDPGMLEELILRVEDQMYEQGNAPAEQIDMIMTYTRKFMQPGPMAAMVVLTYSILGLVMSLIISAIVKKEDPSFEANFIDADLK